jgi:hypothetical protein
VVDRAPKNGARASPELFVLFTRARASLVSSPTQTSPYTSEKGLLLNKPCIFKQKWLILLLLQNFFKASSFKKLCNWSAFLKSSSPRPRARSLTFSLKIAKRREPWSPEPRIRSTTTFHSLSPPSIQPNPRRSVNSATYLATRETNGRQYRSITGCHRG